MLLASSKKLNICLGEFSKLSVIISLALPLVVVVGRLEDTEVWARSAGLPQGPQRFATSLTVTKVKQQKQFSHTAYFPASVLSWECVCVCVCAS